MTKSQNMQKNTSFSAHFGPIFQTFGQNKILFEILFLPVFLIF